MPHLPDEILCMVCTELWHQRDFNTLFNCALSGKQLAPIAVTYLYRTQGVAPPVDEDDNQDIAQVRSTHTLATGLSNKQLLMKCARLWRTIIHSSLGLTSYPYSQYIRTLNLGDLENMLAHEEFTTKIVKEFAYVLARFQRVSSLDPNSAILDTVSRIGDAITKQTPLLEQLIGKVPSGSLSQWIPLLPRLTHLELRRFEAMEDIGTLIRLHCPLFKRLHVPNSYCLRRVSKSDQTYQFLLASLSNLRPKSLESLKLPHIYHPSAELLQALSCHGESLTELELGFFPSGATAHSISLLKSFTNLVSLSLVGGGHYDIRTNLRSKKPSREILTWLKQCQKLKNLSIDEVFWPDWTATFLLETSIQLTSLTFGGYVLQNPKNLYKAIASQTSLESLWLKGDVDENSMEVDILAESLSKLCNLTDLCLEGISECFDDRHVVQLASSLPKLELWSTNGSRVTDAIWDEVATLRSLRVLYFTALTSFTAEGIHGFIKKLRPSNRGLVLFVRNADMESDLSWAEQDLIQRTMAKKIQGRLDFRLKEDGR